MREGVVGTTCVSGWVIGSVPVIADDKSDRATVDLDVEALWFIEAERRLEELRSGRVQGIALEEVFKRAREALKN